MEIVDSTLSSIFSDNIASTVITLFLVLYGGLAAPKLPGFVVKLFDNAIFRILVLSLIVYKGNRDPKFAIMIAVAFTVTMNTIAKQQFMEGFADGTETPTPEDTQTTPEEEDDDMIGEDQDMEGEDDGDDNMDNVEPFADDLEEDDVEGFADDLEEDNLEGFDLEEDISE